jgi:quercetin dioxygenase-like cupin family protein
MKTKSPLFLVLGMLGFTLTAPAPEPDKSAHEGAAAMPQPIFAKYDDLKWGKILPDLGDSSPEISILRVDPKTQATQLMIRTPKAIHIRKHWHSANETHTILKGTASFACDGKKSELGPGSFNFMPSHMIHEAWLPAGSLTFITVDSAWDVNWVEGPPTAADLTK